MAIVGTGHRGTGTWGREVMATCADHVELVGLCDLNPERLRVAAGKLPGTPVLSTDLPEMLAAARPHTLVVCTRDDTHADIIVRALEAGIDVVTEKPMATTAEACRRILEAERRTGRRVDVAFNYRFAPTSRKIRELLAAGRIGTVTEVDFHWYLDTVHGADYFRRWHAYRRHSGSLFVHKATHHFDLLNWWIDADPARVFAQGALRRYGRNGSFRGTRCKGCAHAAECEFHFDMGSKPWLDDLYEAPAAADGYLRDACVFREDIDIWDTMTAAILYANGVQVSYSLNCFMPIEGYHLAFNGTEGRLEVRDYERQPWPAPETEMAVIRNFGKREEIQIPKAEGGHGGGDDVLRDLIFRGTKLAAHLNLPGSRAGAMSCLTGIAARKSMDTARPVKISDLVRI
jgi:predicted dehydrogenase